MSGEYTAPAQDEIDVECVRESVPVPVPVPVVKRGSSISSNSGREEPVDKKKLALQKRKTISQSYLTQFTSLRDFVQPKEEGNDDLDDVEVEGDDLNSDRTKKLIKRKRRKTLQRSNVGFFVGTTVKITASEERKKVFLFKLNIFERVFLTLHRPASSPFSKILSNFMMVVIIISCVFFVISSDPDIKSIPSSCHSPACDNDPVLCPGEQLCEPVEPAWFFAVELTCIIIFTIDYVTRVSLVALVPPRLANIIPSSFDATHINDPYVLDPVYSTPRTIFKYVTNPMNIIDLVAILPFYIGLGTNTQSSVSVIRILRLGRMMRVFKVGKYNVGTRLLVETVKESIPALSLLCFFTLLLVVLFGSMVFFAEGGQYTISSDFPDGAYLRTNVLANGKEESPFRSIVVSCWWVIVTMTTVGYGDLYPTTPFGRMMGVCCMLIGILALALPIGVMGSSFNRNYSKFHGRIEDSLKSSTNVAGLNSIAADMEEKDMVYELNSEVVVTAEDDDDSGGESDGYFESDDGSRRSVTRSTGKCIELSSHSDSVLHAPKDMNLQYASGESIERAKEETIQSISATTRTPRTDVAKDESKVEGIDIAIKHDQSYKMSNKQIRERLQILSSEIGFLMKALDDKEE